MSVQGTGGLRLVVHSLLFVLGFSVVFSMLGASVGLIGYVLQDARRWVNILAGALLVVFGIHVMGLLRFVTVRSLGMAERSGQRSAWRVLAPSLRIITEALYREKRIDYRPKGRGPLASFGVGMGFAVGWTPCVGFVLGGILSAAFNASEATTALLLLMAYSFGLGLPFVVSALALNRARGVLHALQRRSGLVSLISGVALIAFGLLIALDIAQGLARLMGSVPVLSDGFLANSLGETLGPAWMIPAFAAGVLSFLSPCVLPMVPIYLAHLAGAAVVPEGRSEAEITG